MNGRLCWFLSGGMAATERWLSTRKVEKWGRIQGGMVTDSALR